jgi:putative peptidoglycan lipid II flippase
MRLSFWLRASSQSINAKIFRAAVAVGVFTVIAKSGTAVKEITVARSFGRGDALDAFLIAYLLPSFALSLAMGSLGSALIPTFVETRQNQGADAAQRLFSSGMVLGLFVLSAVAMLLYLPAPLYLPYLASGFTAGKLRLTRELLYMLFPFVFFNGVATCVSAVLGALEKFALPALVPLVTPLIVILFVQYTAKSWGPFSLAGGTVAGSLLEAAMLLLLLRMHGLKLKLSWSGLDPGLRTVLGQYVPMLAGTFLMSSTGVVDQSMAAMLPRGSVAALGYANKVVTAFTGVGGLALSTAVLPYFSQMSARNDWDGCRHTLKRYLALVFMFTVPLTLGLAFFAQPLTKLLFQRGAFTSVDTRLVSWVQICYCLQIPFYVGGFLFVRFISSIRRNDVLMYGAAISLVLDIALNFLLMKVWGVAGIALSTSLVYMLSFLFLGVYALRLLAQGRSSAAAAGQEQDAIFADTPVDVGSDHG